MNIITIAYLRRPARLTSVKLQSIKPIGVDKVLYPAGVPSRSIRVCKVNITSNGAVIVPP